MINLQNKSRTMKKVLLLLLSLPGITGFSQDTLTIGQCYSLVEKNWPLSQQAQMFDNSSLLRVQNINKNFLPQVNLNASASYQSAVTEVAIPLPAGFGPLSMPELSKDWYKATLDINESIYSGNVNNYQKKVETYNLQIDQTNLKAELYKLKDRVNQLFFTIIFLQQNQLLFESNRDQLSEKFKEMKAAVMGGAALPMNADVLEAELFRVEQQLIENNADQKASIKMLSELISAPLSDSVMLIIPDPQVSLLTYENKRLENDVFRLQESKTLVLSDMVTTRWNPRISAYGQLGFGRPGLNMLSNDFEPWYIFGAKFTWNFWNWNANKNEKKILGIQANIIKTQQETFDKNLKIQSERDIADITKAQEVLKTDAQIVTLREKVTKAASSQLDNGVITSSDYVSRLKEETQAKLNFEIHKIQLAKAKLAYLYNQGKL
jgi:outer membrane protein TolC